MDRNCSFDKKCYARFVKVSGRFFVIKAMSVLSKMSSSIPCAAISWIIGCAFYLLFKGAHTGVDALLEPAPFNTTTRLTLGQLKASKKNNWSPSWQEMWLCDIVTCCSQAVVSTCCTFLFVPANIGQAGVGPACLTAPHSLSVVPLLLFGLFLFLCLCLFPVAPSIFPLSEFYPTLPQFFSECQA